jgi:hypothetical protein
MSSWRRGRDSNPRYGVNRTHDFQSCTFNRSVTSPLSTNKHLGTLLCYFKDISMGISAIFSRDVLTTYHKDLSGAKTKHDRVTPDAYRCSRLQFGFTGCGESCSLKAAFYPSLTSLSSRNIVGPQSGRRGAESMRSYASFSRGASRNDKLLARTAPPRFAKIT